VIGALLSVGLAGTTATLAMGAYAPNSRLFGPVIGRGPTTSRTLYLTFDDGPSSSATPEILDTLAQYRVPATFFLVGAHVRHSPDIARAIHAAGHEIGNHTDTHRKLHFKGPRATAEELRRAHEAIVSVVGQAPRLFRAPHGYKNPFLAHAAGELGYHLVGWTFGVWDSDCPGAETIRRRVAAKARPGAIVLLHDGDGYDPHGDRSQTAEALKGIITDAREQGFEFRPLAELVA
jgi:peptidoglycan/xylan/chitin deacetylase (PgdA/CDA1 family)